MRFHLFPCVPSYPPGLIPGGKNQYRKVIYISPTGNDSNSGLSPGSAKKNISVSAGGESGGTTFVLMQGTHAPTTSWQMNASGTALEPISIIADPAAPAGTVILDGNSLGSAVDQLIVGGAHIFIQGIKFYRGKKHALSIYGSTFTNVTVTGCTFEDAWESGILAQNTVPGRTSAVYAYSNVIRHCIKKNEVSTGADSWGSALKFIELSGGVMAYNTVEENWGEGLNFISCINGHCYGNTARDNWSVNIYCDNSQTVWIHNNRAWCTSDANGQRFWKTYPTRLAGATTGEYPATNIQIGSEFASVTQRVTRDIWIKGNVCADGTRGFCAQTYTSGPPPAAVRHFVNIIVEENTFRGSVNDIFFASDNAGDGGSLLPNSGCIMRNNVLVNSGAALTATIPTGWTSGENVFNGVTARGWASSTDRDIDAGISSTPPGSISPADNYLPVAS